MKQKEIMSNTQDNKIERQIDEIGDDHISTNIFDTPLREDAFEMDDDTKMQKIEEHFSQIMQIMGLDLTDDSLSGTPRRVAKMYVKELFSGLNPKNLPALTHFKNHYKYNEMLVERDIMFHSNCEHHFVPIVGKAHIAYIANGHVIGLSKLHRVVNHFARRPQVQERMTIQIGEALKTVLGTDSVAVILDADHMCVSSRGINDQTSSTVTSFYGGEFNKSETRDEFIRMISLRRGELKY
ncbi:GTP cyclohydrolase I FolE [Arcticibacterium luteifluviistationis]|uniref:GTP cyclohydrolase 1 n=1 Tax=Arcticibacterium luteifluviistationis TaxID=1784714 RepID=A0A2Z4G792_9BACT|nr:GTP cyclohydrolase I FolE [Arcticibacterium luteifluviistationis]AWV96950.1 GTP cyclohydrolase I FolE [Arcticibacterium luteifluviistationis]